MDQQNSSSSSSYTSTTFCSSSPPYVSYETCTISPPNSVDNSDDNCSESTESQQALPTTVIDIEDYLLDDPQERLLAATSYNTRAEEFYSCLVGFWKKGNFLLTLYLIPVTIALVTVVMVDWRSRCEQPLRLWCVAQVIIQILIIWTNCCIIWNMPDEGWRESPLQSQSRTHKLAVYYTLHRILNLGWLIWFVVGIVWTVQASWSEHCV